jgi:hypothetical protein
MVCPEGPIALVCSGSTHANRAKAQGITSKKIFFIIIPGKFIASLIAMG